MISKLKTLIECLTSDVLLEIRGSEPNVFWLVTHISEKTPERLEQLASGILSGIQGISDNKRILMHWLGIGRNAVLIMKAEQVIANNDIFKIDYSDPYELLDNDMQLLARIWDKQHGTDMGRRGIMTNISNYLVKILKKSDDRTISQIGDSIYGGYVNLESNVPVINSPDDLAKHVRSRVLEGVKQYRRPDIEKLPMTWWKQVVSDAVVNGVKPYVSEGEWVVRGNTLTVPEGSRLLVGVTKLPQDFPEEVRQELKQGKFSGFPGITQAHIASGHVIKSVYQYGLDKKYEVRFLDLNKFEKVQLKLQTQH